MSSPTVDHGHADAIRPGRTVPPWLRRAGPRLLDVVAGGVLLYLFLPVFVIILFSFNDPAGRFNLVWRKFSLDGWKDPFAVEELVEAFENSLQVAAVATAISLVLGTLVAIALVRHRFRGQGLLDTYLVVPLTMPEIVVGSSLLTLFLDFGWNLGFRTVVLAHIMFQVSFVALTVKARVKGFDWSLEDAAMDLGATPARTFRRVTLPLIAPGIAAAAMLSFALSLDDYIITLFVSGRAIQTYPLQIAGAQQRAIPVQINVLATMVLVASLLVIGLSVAWQRWRTRGQVL